jgi:polyisoprenyl-teichoic acid--peptidoglycan teichoic acid transferase
VKPIRFPVHPIESIQQDRSPSFYNKIKPILVTIAIVVFIVLAYGFFSGGGKEFKLSFPGVQAVKQTNGRVNVLLLGNGGGKHDGAYLTDTIMLASYDPKGNQTYFISIPRDMWLDEYDAKVNAVYEIGMKKSTDPLKYTKEAMSKLFGVDINYALRIDFGGFVKAVDEVNGIDVDVARSFDDYLYPIEGKENDLCGYTEQEKEFSEDEAKQLNIQPGKKKVLIDPEGKVATDSADPNFGYEHFTCRYEHISYKTGLSHMDGETALKFVRSRMGSNGEGSDFARSRRQQKVIEAFRSKVLSLETLFNPAKISGLISAFNNSFETDIPIDEMIQLYSLTKKSAENHSFVISNEGKNALLYNPPAGKYRAWVLVPTDPTFGEIHTFVNQVLNGEENNEASSSARPSTR